MVNQGAAILDLARANMPYGTPYFNRQGFQLNATGQRYSFSPSADTVIFIKRIYTQTFAGNAGTYLQYFKNGQTLSHTLEMVNKEFRMRSKEATISVGTKANPTYQVHQFEFHPPIKLLDTDTFSVNQTGNTTANWATLILRGWYAPESEAPSLIDLVNYNYLPQTPAKYVLLAKTLISGDYLFVNTVPAGEIWYPYAFVAGNDNNTSPGQWLRLQVKGVDVWTNYLDPEQVLTGHDYADYLNVDSMFLHARSDIRPLVKCVEGDQISFDFDANPTSPASWRVGVMVAKLSA